jgi:predicted PurR-regulated permease PerM
MNYFLKLPFYARVSLSLVGLYVLINMLYVGGGLLIPFLYAIIISILLNPAVNFLVNKKLNRALAISLVLFVVLLLLASLILLISSQASRLSDALPQLTSKFDEFFNQAVGWVSETFNISIEKINAWVAKTKGELLSGSNAAIGFTLTSVGNGLATIFLTPVYIFMLLFYQPHLLQFLHKLFGYGENPDVTEILTETKTIVNGYLVGLFFEFLIIAVLNTVGLLVIGIEYALLLGLTGALLNIIPYIGGLIAVIIFMIVALVTKSPAHVLYVAILYSVIQFVDNNFIVPKIIGSKVKLNALISLIAVIAGAALWGISGMFLSIPIMAILKLIFDRLDPVKPLGFLMGDSVEPAKVPDEPQDINAPHL